MGKPVSAVGRRSELTPELIETGKGHCNSERSRSRSTAQSKNPQLLFLRYPVKTGCPRARPERSEASAYSDQADCEPRPHRTHVSKSWVSISHKTPNNSQRSIPRPEQKKYSDHNNESNQRSDSNHALPPSSRLTSMPLSLEWLDNESSPRPADRSRAACTHALDRDVT